MSEPRTTVLIITHTDDVSDDYIVQTIGDLPGILNIEQEGTP